MNMTAVRQHLQVLGGYDADTVAAYSPLIESAAKMVALRMRPDADAADVRLVHLAAVKALCMVQNAGSAAESICAFKAGDITVQTDGSGLRSAKQMLAEAEEACRDLLCDSAFAFLDV